MSSGSDHDTAGISDALLRSLPYPLPSTHYWDELFSSKTQKGQRQFGLPRGTCVDMLPHCVSGFYASLTCARLQWCHPPRRKAHTAALRGLCGVTAALRFDLE